MYRKLFLIFLMAAGLAILLILKPWNASEETPPRIYDRLPEADIIGISNVLELSGSLSKTMFYYKLPFRDLLSPGFILSQGKSYGLDVQAPVCFFVNEREKIPFDWGIMLSVRDSSKVRQGIEHLRKFTTVRSTITHNTIVYTSAVHNVQMAYGEDWMFVYQGDDFEATLRHILKAKHNDISPRWREFVNKYYKSNIRLVASLASPEFEEWGIESAGVSLSNDSTGLIFTTVIKQADTLSFRLKPTGPSFLKQEFTRYAANLHFDVQRLRTHPADPLYRIMKKYSAKIGFPLEDFLQSWEGDLAFRQGGFENTVESYIESELDENFNVSEVSKYRNVKVPGFSLYLSMNVHCTSFLQQLRTKGILTSSDGKSRLLFSPPLIMQQSDSSLVFRTSNHKHELEQNSLNHILWSYHYTPLEFVIDSTTVRTVYGKVRLPLRKIIRDNLQIE